MSLFGHLSSSNGIVGLATSRGPEQSCSEIDIDGASGNLDRPCSPRKRTYVGTIGAPCDVVLAVNQQRVDQRAKMTLPSGALLRIGEDGAWMYTPRPDSVAGSAVSMDSFTYLLQTPSGPVSGIVNVFLSPVPADHQILTRSYGMVSSAHGDGSSAACPLTLRFRMVTGTTVLLDPRDDSATVPDGDSDRAAVVLSTSKCVTASVRSDGLISLHVRAGYCGEASCTVLVETGTGMSEWLEVALDVIPACLFTDHRAPDSTDDLSDMTANPHAERLR